ARVIGHALTPVRRGIDARLEEFPEQPAQPAGDAYQRARSDRSARGFSDRVAIAVEHQPDAGGERRAVDVIRQPADVARTAAPDREIENLLGDLRHAVEDRAAAGQHDAGVEALLVAGAADLVPHQMEDLLGARLQDLGQDAPRHDPRLAAA